MNFMKQMQRARVQKQQLPPLEHFKKDPSLSSGILAYPLDKILAPHQDLLDRVRQIVGDEQFERYYSPLILRYASAVHLLPASQYHHHREIGGLLAHGLEVAYHSLVAFKESKYRVESSHDEQQNREATHILALACFLGGLAHDFPKAYTDFKISDTDKKLVYKSFFTIRLLDWLKENNIKHYHFEFLPDRHKSHQAMLSIMLDCLVPKKINSYLCSSGENWLTLEIFLGVKGFGSDIISGHIIKADQKSVENYIQSSKKLPSPSNNAGMAPHEYLTTAIKQFLSDGTWQINAPGGAVKLIDNHLYLVFPQAAKEMIALWVRDHVTRIPREPDGVAQLLLEWGIIDEGMYGTPYCFFIAGGTKLKTVQLLGESNYWLNLPPGTAPRYNALDLPKQQSEMKKPITCPKKSDKEVVHRFFQALMSADPPFPVQPVGEVLCTPKASAEKWFSEHGVSRTQMLRYVKNELLGMSKIKTSSGEEKMIGPPSIG